MEEIQDKKKNIREDIAARIKAMSDSERERKTRCVEDRLFDFANFLEARVALLYVSQGCEIDTSRIVQKSYDYHKVVVLPAFNGNNIRMSLFKVDHFDRDLKPGPRGVLEPEASRCKKVPIEKIDIAIIPGYAFDEKGGRIGSGNGYYDRFIPKLAITTRKVALTFEEQILPQIPMESHDKYVDIIITDQRVIYKI